MYSRISLILFSFAILLQVEAQKRALVVSGGGARGAWGGGVVQSLVETDGNHYDVVVGTSTGSLMAPLIVQEDFVKLREMYTSVNQRSIFNVNPFKTKRDQDGNLVGFDIKGLKALWRLIWGKPTLGETKNLRKLIESTYPQVRYDDIVNRGEFIIAVVNFSESSSFFFSSKDHQGPQLRPIMLDHIWRSSNQPLFMTLDCTEQSEVDLIPTDMDGRPLTVGDCWVDAGIRDNVPLLKGIQFLLNNSDSAVTDTIDVVVNNTYNINLDPFSKKRILPSLLRTIDVLSYDVRFNDVDVPGELIDTYLADVSAGQLDLKSEPSIVVNLNFMPQSVFDEHPYDLFFDEESMDAIWDQGLAGNTFTKSICLTKQVAKLLVGHAKEENILY